MTWILFKYSGYLLLPVVKLFSVWTATPGLNIWKEGGSLVVLLTSQSDNEWEAPHCSSHILTT